MGYILPLLSAVIYFFSFSTFTNGYLIFLSLIPFFYSISYSSSNKKALIIGILWGITLSSLFSIPLFNALITEYELSIFYSTILIIVSIYIPYGIIYGTFALSYKYFFDNAGIYFPLIAASLWIMVDYTMSITPIFLPWGFAGYSQTNNLSIQICDITGIYGVTFVIALINSLFNGIIYYKKKYLKSYITAIVILIFIISAYGTLRIQNIEKIIQSAEKPAITAAVIQGNFNSKEKWDSRNTSAVISTYINMTKLIIEKSNIIVWPETILNADDKQNLDIISGISSLLKKDQLFIAGAVRNGMANNVYNSIFLSDNRGLNYIYDKKILFPFTETSFAGFSSGKYMDSPSIFDRGKTKPICKTDITTLGFTICLESIYPDYVRKIKNLGATILINVANDSWFGNNYEPYMNLYSNVARAIENRFYIIRSANSGISAIISPSGKIIDSIKLNTRDKIVTSLSVVTIPTFYAKTGNLIILIALLIIIFSLLYQLKIHKNT